MNYINATQPVTTTAPDTAPGQLPHTGLDEPSNPPTDSRGMPFPVTAGDIHRQEQNVHAFIDNGDPQALAELTYPGLLRMPKRVLQQLWKESLNMPETTYCMLAMYADGVGAGPGLESFDADAFIERWTVRWETEKKGKKGSVEYVPHTKAISHGALAKVISSFEKKDRAIAKRSDLQLTITWEA